MEIGLVRPVNIVDQMRTAYLDYAMSVIVSRALPDARDGLKPVQRRILYGMWDMGIRHNTAFKKCARITGAVMGQMHPHGDSSVYEALVRMAQEWNMRHMLIEGQGNFGCFTADTKIKLLDGTERSFAELALLPPAEIFHVYAVDATGRIVVGEGRYARITRRDAPLVELTFDDGSTVRCTPDHRFMLRDGAWKEAAQLTVEDSLMAGYFDTTVGGTSRDDVRVLQPTTEQYEFVHQLVEQYNAHKGRAGAGQPLADTSNVMDAPVLTEEWADTPYARTMMRTKIVGYAAKLVAQFGRDAITPALYDAQRHAAWLPDSTKALRYFDGFDELVRVAATHNHRVVRVEWLQEAVDVYDITVNEHHNFMLANGVVVSNSLDGDNAAAQRYTEARVSAIAEELLFDIEKNTVDFRANYDGTFQEPSVMPAKLPNLLLNGASGIAVGMATNIPPHNLGELCEAVTLLIENPEATVEELLQVVPGPDFPTGGIILGTEGIVSAYSTGKGHVIIRAKAHVEEAARGAFNIVVTEMPFQVNKARLQERIAELVKDKKIEGIRDVRDESDRTGIRLVVILKQDAQPRKVLNQLYKFTAMQSTFGVNMLALVDGNQPRVLTLKKALQQYIEYRQVVIRRRTQFELDRARARAHILEGIKIALDALDAIIQTIRESRTRESARNNLMRDFRLSELQSNAILEMQLGRLASMERKKIEDELQDVLKTIRELETILSDDKRVLGIIKSDMTYLKDKYANPRRTRIMAEASGEISAEDLIPDIQVLVTITDRGYIKRLPADTYRTQNRGGKGMKGMVTRAEDVVEHMLTCRSLDDLLFFTDRGKVYQLKAHEVPDASRTAKGLPLVNLISLEPGEQISSILNVTDFSKADYLVMATVKGKIKRTALSDYSAVRSNGLIAIGIEEGDVLRWVRVAHGDEDILLTSVGGQTIRFAQSEVRPMGRPATGVQGMRVEGEDRVISMELVETNADLLVITTKGFGKRTALSDYPTKGRAGMGVITIKLRGGDQIAAAHIVKPTDAVALISRQGIVLKVRAREISQLGRLTQGVTIMNLKAGDAVAAVTIEAPQDEPNPDVMSAAEASGPLFSALGGSPTASLAS